MSTKTDTAGEGAALDGSPSPAKRIEEEGAALDGSPSPVERGRPGNGVAAPSRVGRALVVDDDALVRLMFSDALKARGFEVQTAADAMTGLQLLSENILGLDVLLTDVLMPGQDGIEFVRTIRTVGGESDLVVVAVTASEDPSHRTRLLEAGADLVLYKSLGPDAIAYAVEEIVL
ncbi:MAG TPA: response regulator [Anaeromyxobacteraceae bacterium]|jgi:CheY-like chemotaxis protein|nr:response regulator [Anaeromyxobacteraceae bacterium]